EDHDEIFAYIRSLGNEKLLVVCNYYEQNTTFILPESITFNEKELLISNYQTDESEEIKEINLRPYEARVYKLG
ncbi:alpha-glucosidase C-terminal domain-containing protein, partial [Niallia sp. 01092]|uniref:alpha-glucosidase C-terminal domain-containing protein n=1 Tax=unclassified Niallia TaxID=2837522 RepID=UPI003FD68ED1